MTESQMITEFLAKRGPTLCPARKAAGPSMENFGFEEELVEQPVPPISKVRAILARDELAREELKAQQNWARGG